MQVGYIRTVQRTFACAPPAPSTNHQNPVGLSKAMSVQRDGAGHLPWQTKFPLNTTARFCAHSPSLFRSLHAPAGQPRHPFPPEQRGSTKLRAAVIADLTVPSLPRNQRGPAPGYHGLRRIRANRQNRSGADGPGRVCAGGNCRWGGQGARRLRLDHHRSAADRRFCRLHRRSSVDPCGCRARQTGESIGTTIAQGFLTLSLLPAMQRQIVMLPGDVLAALNYGTN
jgi:hypothetical protein